MDFEKRKIAFVCPGQGSQFVGMGIELAHEYPTAKEIFQQADDILNINLSKLIWEGPEKELNDTINTQPALMIHSVAAWRVLMETYPHITPTFIAGHSMGELTALVFSGALTFVEGLKLVRRRGELMKKSGKISPGKMAAILGLDIPTVEEIIQGATRENEIVQIANDNCPGQVVISGASAAVDRAIEAAKETGAKRAVPLAVSIAAHSPLMSHAQEDFSRAVMATPITQPEVPIIGNVSARPLKSVDEIRCDLQSQLTHRVRWTESIEFMIVEGIDVFLELGSGEVLSGLIRRINKEVERYSFGKPSDYHF
jgi:[acyl-carrier-protein] S-malonyltransferase